MKKNIVVFLLFLFILSITGCSGISSGSEQKKIAITLFPAYEKKNGETKWGYIDSKGKFSIKATYDEAGDFNDSGVAIIKKDGLYGIINNNKKTIVKAIYESISEFNQGYAIAKLGKKCKTINSSGKIVGEFESEVKPYSNQKAVLSRRQDANNYLYGYINSSGRVIAEPKYLYASDYKNDKAVVLTKDKKYKILDKLGKEIYTLKENSVGDISENILNYKDSNNKYGYISCDGKTEKKIIPAKFDYADIFRDGVAIVGIKNAKTNTLAYGLINKKGEYVIEAACGKIKMVGKNLYAVSKVTNNNITEPFVKMALFNSSGKRLTEFNYYDIQDFNENYASVCTDASIFFIDTTGEEVKELPKLAGIGSMKILGGIIKSVVDGKMKYITKQGNDIWKPEDVYILSEGSSAKKTPITVSKIRYGTDRFKLIFYPEIANYRFGDREALINQELRNLFITSVSPEITYGNSNPTEVKMDFDTILNKDLLILKSEGYILNGLTKKKAEKKFYYFLNIRTGAFFTLKDLFLQNTNYISKLNELVTSTIETKKSNPLNKFLDVKVNVTPTQKFLVEKDELIIFYPPGEIAEESMGFIDIHIAYKDIIDLLNTNGDFWKSYSHINTTSIKKTPTTSPTPKKTSK